MDAIGALSGAPPGGTAPDAFSQLTSGQFVKILFTELANQDPIQPNDTNALLGQLSSLRSIQADMDLTTRLQTIVTQGQLSSAAALIGRQIQGRTEGLDRVSGRVVSVARTDSGPVLTLDGGARVPMENLETIDATVGGDS